MKTKAEVLAERDREILASVRAWKVLEDAEDNAIMEGNQRDLHNHRKAIANVQERILRLAGYLGREKPR